MHICIFGNQKCIYAWPQGLTRLIFPVRLCPPLVSREEILPCPSRECPWCWDTVWCDVVLICVLQWHRCHNRNFSFLAMPLVLGQAQLRWRTNLRVPASIGKNSRNVDITCYLANNQNAPPILCRSRNSVVRNETLSLAFSRVLLTPNCINLTAENKKLQRR